MSAILSAEDLNDFISPGVACIKPVEALPSKDTNASVSTPTSTVVDYYTVRLTGTLTEPL